MAAKRDNTRALILTVFFEVQSRSARGGFPARRGLPRKKAGESFQRVKVHTDFDGGCFRINDYCLLSVAAVHVASASPGACSMLKFSSKTFTQRNFVRSVECGEWS